MAIISALISPHPPLLLPWVGSDKDRTQVKKTLSALENLNKTLEQKKPDKIIISSPHPDWGFEVPLFFLAQNFQGEIKKILIELESPQFYFQSGQNFYRSEIIKNKNRKFALIASGDLSHCLKEEGPYGFHPDGPKFDQDLIEALKRKDIEKILKLDDLYPEAGECGLRSFCFLLGILEAAGLDWQTEILSYEYPFGVGYLVANLKIK